MPTWKTRAPKTGSCSPRSFGRSSFARRPSRLSFRRFWPRPAHNRGTPVRLAMLALLVLGSACRTLTPSPIGRVQVQPPSLSPELRNQTNRWDVHYHLNAPATMSSRIVSSDGQQWPIAIDVPRPTPGDYVLQFDGTVAGPGQNERRVLADGDYQLILDVEAGEQRQQIPVTLPIRGADTTTPDITGLSLLPDHISPN